MGTLIGLLGGALVIGALLWLIVALGPYFWIPALLLVTPWLAGMAWGFLRSEYEKGKAAAKR